jgi:uncharacterized membrane protein
MTKTKDTNIRTLTKTISYRFWVMVSMVAVGLAFGKDAAWITKFIVMSWTVGLVSFIIHEKLWNLSQIWKENGYDKKIRSIAKTITWRIYSLIAIFLIAKFLGGSGNAEALSYTIASNIVFVVVHYTHERVWNMFSWGRKEVAA